MLQFDESYGFIEEMMMDAPIAGNITASRMMGRMLLIRAVLPHLCTGNHMYYVVCRYSHRVYQAVEDAMQLYQQNISNRSWGTAFR